MRSSTGLARAAAAALLATGTAFAMAADRPLPDAASPDPVKALGLEKTLDEEFDGTALDRHRWTQEDPHATVAQRTLSGNAERQVYVDPDFLGLGYQPVTVHGGMMTITARPFTPAERMVVHAAVDALPPGQRAAPLADLAYASGRISNRSAFHQRYGYFEARLRFTPGRGLWPAFWLLPADGSWPPEIDIVEALGHEPNVIHSTVHSTGTPSQLAVQSTLTPTDDGFHRYGVLWKPDTIDYYVDGVKTGSVRTPADVNKPMYVILNLAVGGYWPGYPDAATRFPATMDVDYVRAWRLPARSPRPAG